jgi:hypothetical protein
MVLGPYSWNGLFDSVNCDLMDVVACYLGLASLPQDPKSFRSLRKQALLNRGCCCDTCYHDVRFAQGFEYPPREGSSRAKGSEWQTIIDG